jgi:iron complex transport system ATP-binding protein
MTTLLECRSLGLRAGPKPLLSGLDLCIEPGQLWALIGRNGSGKTSLLHALAGVDGSVVAAGSIALAGRPLAEWPARDRACLRGLLPQSQPEAFDARVLETVLMGRHPHLGRWQWEGDADRAIALAALASVDMAPSAGRALSSLSGGERQRVGLAAVLAQDPLLLLLDEPLAHLDLRHQVGLLRHLRAWVGGPRRAALLAVHDLNLARRFCTHALVLDGEGGVPVQGPVDEAMNPPALGAALGHPVAQARVDGQTVFTAA